MVASDPHSYWIVLLDIEDFSLRTEVAQATLHDELYGVVEFAVARAGLDLATCPVQDRGDGMLILVPTGTSPTKLLRELTRGLDDALRAHRAKYNLDHRMRLRVGLNQGLVIRQGKRWTGTAINDLARLVDAGPVKGVLEKARSAQLVLVVSEHVYTSIVRGGYPGIDPAAYLPADFVTKHDERRRGWVTVPGYSAPPGLPADAGEPPGAAGGTAVRDGAGRGDGGTAAGSAVPPSTPAHIHDVTESAVAVNGDAWHIGGDYYGGDHVRGDKHVHHDADSADEP
ncbi:hypothetical protein ACLVWQ_37225 [Streptomyces sp. CWNU-52B]|uniref:hypothetical protein n=1 Tax=unclassified Streptomyces TaxID=2593676 RepID=UPI0039BFF1DB